MDSIGDVLLAGPAVRAVARTARRVVLLAGPRGAAAARMLPGVDRVIEWCAPWVDPEPPAVNRADTDALCAAVRAERPDAALVLTSFHQSPLPLALLLRLAGVPWIGAVSVDYPGSLLDLRHRVPDGIPESERMLSLAGAAGYRLAPGDPGRLAVRGPLPDTTALTGPDGYVAMHVGASAPARALPVDLAAAAAARLCAEGIPVVVTAAAVDKAEAAAVAGAAGTDLAGRTDLAELAGVLSRASVLVAGNTGPAHLAAAVGTPVVSLFSPVVPASAWAPYGVRLRLLGDQGERCAGTRARICPVPGHPCLNSVSADEVVRAVYELAAPPGGGRGGAEDA
ncbi:glycosyltransferase family 9 protein [Actinorugispora endophytica]|nr:glycosyltransferase family 9 protein [Actinorugispora endophytica]